MKKKNRITQIIIHIFLILACAVTIYPLLLCLGVSFTDEREVMNEVFILLALTISIASYRYVFSAPKRIINAYKVTAFYSIVQTLLMLFFNSLMAYPLSRRNFRFRNKLNFYLYFTCLFSGGAVPVYILNTRYLHLNDTIWIYIIPGLVGAWPIF